MISQITLFIEHGETTDDLEAFCEYVSNLPTDHDVQVLDYDVIVDIPDPSSKVSSVNRIMDLLGPTS